MDNFIDQSIWNSAHIGGNMLHFILLVLAQGFGLIQCPELTNSWTGTKLRFTALYVSYMLWTIILFYKLDVNYSLWLFCCYWPLLLLPSQWMGTVGILLASTLSPIVYKQHMQECSNLTDVLGWEFILVLFQSE